MISLKKIACVDVSSLALGAATVNDTVDVTGTVTAGTAGNGTLNFSGTTTVTGTVGSGTAIGTTTTGMTQPRDSGQISAGLNFIANANFDLGRQLHLRVQERLRKPRGPLGLQISLLTRAFRRLAMNRRLGSRGRRAGRANGSAVLLTARPSPQRSVRLKNREAFRRDTYPLITIGGILWWTNWTISRYFVTE